MQLVELLKIDIQLSNPEAQTMPDFEALQKEKVKSSAEL